MPELEPTTRDGGSIAHLTQPRNRHFAGRQRVLESLHKTLSADKATPVQVVYGAGGVGKTHLALEYAYRHQPDYSLVWWLPADEPSTLAFHFSELAAYLGVFPAMHAGSDEQRQNALRELEKRQNWLLIFDNAQDSEIVKPYLPRGRGRVLITSRSSKWRGVGESFCLRVLERAESIDFLVRRTGLAYEPVVFTLAQALGDLPLAMEQAAALIREAKLTFTEYLRRFESHWAELLQSGRSSGEYPDTVAMTWELASREVEQADSEVAALLKVLSFFAPWEIGKTFLRRAAATLPVPLCTRFGSAGGLEGAVQQLRRFSLINADDRSISVHHLISAMTRDRLPQEQQQNWCELALTMMEQTFKFSADAHGTWPECGEALPHALSVAAHAESAGILPAVNSKLLNRVGEYLYQSGQFRQAKGVFERAILLSDDAHGTEDPRRAAIANNLGRVHKRLGDAGQARAYFENALTLDQAAYGDQHPHVAEVINNYGTVLHENGDFATALEQFQWALEICRTHYGSENAKVATITNNLGYALASSGGDLERALDHLTAALQTAQVACGPHHPLVASIRTNLGIALRLQGRSEAARAELEKATSLSERVLGPDHVEVGRGLAQLGTLYQERGDLASARRCLQRAVHIHERTFGSNHLLLIEHLNNLGRCLKALDDVDGSASCYQRAAGILRQRRTGQAAVKSA